MVEITIEQRKLITSLMRKGYGVHPERQIVLIEPALFARDSVKEQILAEAARFAEADFVVLGGGDFGLPDDDNIYCLNHLSGEEAQFLESIADLHLTDSETADPNIISTTIQTAMDKEGYNRTGTTLLAVEEGDTSYKIHLRCPEGQ